MTKKTERAVGRASEKQVDEALSEQWGDSLGARRVLAAEVRALRDELKNAKHLAPPTENKDERERLLEDAINDLVDCYPQLDSNSIVDSQDDAARQVLLALYNKISDAADKAGYERGREAGRKLSFDEVRDVVVQDEMQSARELNALQSQHARLIVSAREAEQAMRVAAAKLQEKHGYEPLAIKECANVLRDLVDAALAETLEEKKT